MVVLEVGGMKCGGCSAAVKRMLVQRPDVAEAAVNLLTETAAVTFKCAHLIPLSICGHVIEGNDGSSRFRIGRLKLLPMLSQLVYWWLCVPCVQGTMLDRLECLSFPWE